MQNKVKVLVAAALIVALLAGGIVGSEWQKVQPVDITVSWYNETENTACFDVWTLTQTNQVTIHPQENIVEYNVQIAHPIVE
jgi:hypothetical protein